MLLNIGNEDAALKLFSQAQDLGERQLGATALPVASSLNGLALINQRRGNMRRRWPFLNVRSLFWKKGLARHTRTLLPFCIILLTWLKRLATRIVH